MKLLLTTLDYEGAGGIQTLAQSLVSGLRRNGHTVEVLVADSALGSSDAESGVSNPESLEVGCDVRQQWLNQTDHDDLRSWLQGNRLYRRTREAIEEEEYDIIHALHINCWPSLVAAPADTATVL